MRNRSTINGTLPIEFGWNGLNHRATVIGGRYDDFPEQGMFGVCVRHEPTSRDYSVKLGIHDFSVPPPSMAQEVSDALMATIAALFDGEAVYIGCMGGIGRTGMFMALLVKATMPHVDPVEYVRENYLGSAVETREQQDYIAGFDTGPFKWWIRGCAWKRLRGKSCLAHFESEDAEPISAAR